MKKIFLYTDTPIAGGAEKHMLLLAKHLRDFGHEVKVICSNFKSLNSWCATLKKENIPIMRLTAWHKHDPRQFFQLKKLLKKEKPDILHIHLWNPGAGRYAFMAAASARREREQDEESGSASSETKRALSNKAQKTKVIATEHDPFVLKGIKKILKKMALRKTDHTIAISHENARKMLQWYPEIKGKITLIHNGIDLESFSRELKNFSVQEKDKLKKELFQANSNDFIITSIAALHPRKGLKYLIAAMPKVLHNRPECKLVVVGEGPQKKELQKLIKILCLEQKVLLLGQRSDIIKILQMSDIFVLPSVKEAFGLVLLEAMAAKIPIIATNVGGIPEIVENGKSGILVAHEDSNTLAEKTILLINNQNLRQKLASAGLKRIKYFNAGEMAKKTEIIYGQAS